MKYQYLNKIKSTLKLKKSVTMLSCLYLLTNCAPEIEYTSVEVIDPKRHYYSLLQGQNLDLVYEIKNSGDVTLNISDVLPSCGCIVVNNLRPHIPPKESVFLELTYNSNKNIGLVNHQIYVYGNIKGLKEDEPLKLSFDVHVVPDGDYTKDYEELYQKEKDKDGGLKDAVDGSTNTKGYYIDKHKK